MRSHSAFAALLLLSSAARADFVIEEKIDSPNSHEHLTFKIKGKNVRAEITNANGENSTVIIRGDTGKVNILNDREKSSLAFNLQALREEKRKALWDAGIDLALVSPQSTGKTEQIGGRETEVYEYRVAGEANRIWVAKDFPNAEAAQKALSEATNALDATSDPSLIRVPGFPVRWQTGPAGGRSTTSVVSVKEEEVAGSEFNIPPDYVIITNPK